MKRLFFYNILFITNIAIAQSGLNGSVANQELSPKISPKFLGDKIKIGQ